MKKISILAALLITFLLSMAGQTAMAAGIKTGGAFSQVQKHEMSALVAEPVNFNHERSQNGAKDTVLGVCAVIDCGYGGGILASNSPLMIDKGATIVASYKDRPGWIAL